MSVRSGPALLLLASLAGGVAGAFASYGVTRSGGTEAKAAASATGEPDLDARIAALEQRVSELSRRTALAPSLRALQAASRAPSGAAAAVPSGDAPRAAEPAAMVDDPVFEAAVRDVVDRVREERDNERQLSREAKDRAAAQRWSAALGEKLALRDDQKTALETMAQEFYDRVRDAFTSGDAGTPPEPGSRREAVRALRQEYETKIRGVLDPKQADDYEKLDDDFKLGRHRFRGPR